MRSEMQKQETSTTRRILQFSMCARPRWSGRSSTRLPALTQLTQIPPWPQDTRTHHGITTASSRTPRRGRVAVPAPAMPASSWAATTAAAASSLLPAHSRIAWRDRRSTAAVWRQLKLRGCSQKRRLPADTPVRLFRVISPCSTGRAARGVVWLCHTKRSTVSTPGRSGALHLGLLPLTGPDRQWLVPRLVAYASAVLICNNATRVLGRYCVRRRMCSIYILGQPGSPAGECVQANHETPCQRRKALELVYCTQLRAKKGPLGFN
jgi:hypothetical protein